MKKVISVLEKISNVSVILGSIALGVMMMTTVVDVLIRLFNDKSFLGGTEIVSYFLTAVVYFGVVYCTFHRGMITVDLFKVPKPLEYLMRFLGMATCGFIVYSVTTAAFLSMKTGGSSLLISIPKWPFMFITSFGFLMMLVIMFVQIITDVQEDSLNKRLAIGPHHDKPEVFDE